MMYITSSLSGICHYGDVIMDAMASQITSLTIVYSTVYSGADQRKHQSSASLAFVRGIHRWPVNSLHKWRVTRKMFPFHDVIMLAASDGTLWHNIIACIAGHWWKLFYIFRYTSEIYYKTDLFVYMFRWVLWFAGDGEIYNFSWNINVYSHYKVFELMLKTKNVHQTWTES